MRKYWKVSRVTKKKILRLFRWTVENIKPVPKGLPVVDDHPLNIIIRGYGAEDQQAEVLALLASYAGYPTGVQRIKLEGGSAELRITLTKMGHRLFVFDVARKILYQNTSGHLIDLQHLRSDQRLIQATVGEIKIEGHRYERFLQAIDENKISFYRMQMQNPWSRLKMALFTTSDLSSSPAH